MKTAKGGGTVAPVKPTGRKAESGASFYKLCFDTMDNTAAHNGIVLSQPHPGRSGEAELCLKVVVAGGHGVGKSAIVSRLCEDFFREAHASTVGVDYKTHVLHLPHDGPTIKLELFDTPGLEKFRAVASNYYQSAHGVLLVYDITDRASFESLEGHLREIKHFLPPDAEVVLVGSKADAADELADRSRVPYEEADLFAARHGLSLFEVSARTGLNLRDVFVELGSKMHEKLTLGPFDGLEEADEFVFGETDNFTANRKNCVWCFL